MASLKLHSGINRQWPYRVFNLDAISDTSFPLARLVGDTSYQEPVNRKASHDMNCHGNSDACFLAEFTLRWRKVTVACRTLWVVVETASWFDLNLFCNPTASTSSIPLPPPCPYKSSSTISVRNETGGLCAELAVCWSIMCPWVAWMWLSS